MGADGGVVFSPSAPSGHLPHQREALVRCVTGRPIQVCRIPYAERKLATGRATFRPINVCQSIRLALTPRAPGHAGVYKNFKEIAQIKLAFLGMMGYD